MKNRRGKNNFYINNYEFIFNLIVGLLLFIFIVSIVAIIGIKFSDKQKLHDWIMVIIGCITSFGTLLTVYVALNKPEPKPKINTNVWSTNNEKQFYISFTDNNFNSLVTLKLKKTMVINQNGKNSIITDSAVNCFPDEINQEILLDSNCHYKKLTLDKYNFAKAVTDYITRFHIKLEAFILIFITNYGDEIQVKIPEKVID